MQSETVLSFEILIIQGYSKLVLFYIVIIYTDSTVMLLVMDSIYTKANDSDLVSLCEGFCRRRFP